MRDILLFVHILGWAQWMGAHLALAGLLRKPDLYAEDVGPVLAKQLNLLWITLFSGGVLAVFGGMSLAGVNPGYARMGFFLTKSLLVLIGFFIALVPMGSANRRLQEGGPPLNGIWVFVSLANFVAMIGLGVFKPF